MNYYNEFDPKAAAWIRELIKAGAIAPGEVDERSIIDVKPEDLKGYTQCHFFAGIGVWSHALRCAGWPDARPVWTGSCPCQGFSTAGKGLGFADPRHLWPAWFKLIRECRPVVCIGEQVASAIRHGWLDLVFTDMERIGYSCGAAVMGAHSVGAPHIRQRLYFVGDTAEWGLQGLQRERGQGTGWLSTPPWERRPTGGFWSNAAWLPCRDGKARAVEPGTFPLAHGAPARVGRLRGYGNALCAPVAEEFIKAYMEIDP